MRIAPCNMMVRSLIKKLIPSNYFSLGCRNTESAHPRVTVLLVDGKATDKGKTIEFCSKVHFLNNWLHDFLYKCGMIDFEDASDKYLDAYVSLKICFKNNKTHWCHLFLRVHNITGFFNCKKNHPLTLTLQLKDEGMNLIVIQIGSDYLKDELESYVPTPVCEHLSYVPKFADLTDLRQLVDEKICDSKCFLNPCKHRNSFLF